MKKTVQWLDANFEPILMALLFFAMILLVSLQVVLRIFGKGFNWGEEMSRLLFVWLSFISFGYLTRNNRHVRMAFARDFLPDKARRAVMLLCDLLFMVFIVFGFTAAVTVCKQATQYGDNLVTIHATANVLYAAGLVGFLLMFFRRLQTIWWKIKHFNSSFARFENANGKYYASGEPFFVWTKDPQDVSTQEERLDSHLSEGG